MKTVLRFLTLMVIVLCLQSQLTAGPTPIRAVIVTMFEQGAATGDTPGELQLWVERENLDQTLPFPMGIRPLHLNEETGVLAICTGMGIANATASIMALGVDERFDLTKAYWIVAGIAGIDPENASLGSAAWAEWIIDGDLLYEIDAREIPEDWPYGIVPIGGKTPNDLAGSWTVKNAVFRLNPGLVEWAYRQSRDSAIEDRESIAAFRRNFEGYPEAVKPPKVLKGDHIAASTYWHGELLNEWANDWVMLYTDGRGEFVTSAMEDTGTLVALTRLSQAGKVDRDRVLVLRTGSNYTMQPPDETAAWSTTAPYPEGGYPAKLAAWKAGSAVLDALLAGWDTYQHQIPAP
ncbi:MAG: purine nucleoside permease [Opitutales bacterium]